MNLLIAYENWINWIKAPPEGKSLKNYAKYDVMTLEMLIGM